MQRRSFSLSILGAAWVTPARPASAAQAKADSYPSRPIRIVVPYVPGGPVDAIARILGEYFARSMGASVMVENRPGAGSNIGSAYVAKSAADGHTLLLVPGSTLTINDALYSTLNYSPSRDFEPIAVVGDMPLIVTVNNDIPVQSMQELVAWGQARKQPMALSSPGNGSTPHLAAELFQREGKVPMIHVPFKGGAESATAIISGHVAAGIETPPSVLPHIQSGRLRALAVAGPQRLQSLPDVPTTSEAGFPGVQIISWFGLVAPSGTPQPVIHQLHGQVHAALQDRGVRERFATLSIRPAGGTPAEFAQLARTDRSKWHKVIRDAGIRLD